MTVTSEKVFPRGGKNPALSKPFQATKFSLFNRKQGKMKKKTKKKKLINEKDGEREHSKTIEKKSGDGELIVKYVDDLTSAVLHEGMLVLGIVNSVTEKFIKLSLPGGLWGIAKLNNISQFFNHLVLNSKKSSEVPKLKDLFHVGEALPCKVISGTEEDKKKFALTLDPKQINSTMGDMEDGLMVVGSVKSEEDHGYVIDLGIDTVNGFLNFEKVENGEKFPVGKLVRCVVVHCTNVPGSTSVQLSTLDEDVKTAHLSSQSSYPIHAFVPGLQFKLTVTRVLKNGLEVTYRKNEKLKGLINEDYLPGLFPNLSNIQVGTKYTGILLYVKPLVNMPYFKVASRKPESWIFKYGQIVKGKVVKGNRSGVTFRIGTKLIPMKCFVPFGRLRDREKLLDNELDVDTLYPRKKVVESIRLKDIDYMRRCYMGTMDKSAIDEKFFAVTDLTCGQIVPAQITSIENNYVDVKVGNVYGSVHYMDLTDVPINNPKIKFKVGQKIEARVLEVDEANQRVRLTTKPTLLSKGLALLTDYSKAKKDASYMGTILSVEKSKLVVKFFNGVKGEVPQVYTPYRCEPTLRNHYVVGQLVKCFVVRSDGTQLQLSLLAPDHVQQKFETGEMCEVEVAGVGKQGLAVHCGEVDSKNWISGMIPFELISDYPGLGKTMASRFEPHQKLTAFYVRTSAAGVPIFGISESLFQFYDSLGSDNPRSKIQKGQVLPFLFQHFDEGNNVLILTSLLPKTNRYTFFVDLKKVSDMGCTPSKLPVCRYQLVQGVILEKKNKRVSVSLKLSQVWDKDFHGSLSLLDVYVDGIKRLVDYHKRKEEKYVKDISLGSLVTIPRRRTPSDPTIHEADKAVLGSGNSEKGTVTGRVVWIDPKKKVLCVNTSLTEDITEEGEAFDLVDAVHRGKIVYVGEEVVVAVLKGKANGRLVFLPRKRHMNDFTNPECPYKVGCVTKIHVERGQRNNLVGIDREVILLAEKTIWKKHEDQLRDSLKRKLPPSADTRQSAKTRKMGDENDSEMEIIDVKLSGKTKIKEEAASDVDADDGDVCFESVVGDAVQLLPQHKIKQEEASDLGDDPMNESALSCAIVSSDVEIKSEEESEEEQVNGKEKDLYAKEKILFSSSDDSDSDDDDQKQVEDSGTGELNVGFNWDVQNNRQLLSGANLQPEEESSGDDEEESSKQKKKRVRLTKSEREEQARLEEERLRQVEERLMRTDLEPETADDFDRAVLAKPNSSALWIKYMAFHLQGTEIEKARAVARRALKTIAFNEEQEKLNVWVALLNLENLYGNEDSLNKTLSEALACNEPYHVQLHMLNMHGQSNKFDEMERVGNLLLKKFKDVENMWHDVGLAYFKVGKLECARNVLQRALQILEKKRHVELISQFAQMENRYGSKERAQTLYETILTSFPKRVDVWSCYVDMLVKSGLVELARHVLERATSQRLPPKKMRTLFKKFLTFEEKFGTEEGVEKVRQAAVDYIENVASMGK